MHYVTISAYCRHFTIQNVAYTLSCMVITHLPGLTSWFYLKYIKTFINFGYVFLKATPRSVCDVDALNSVVPKPSFQLKSNKNPVDEQNMARETI